MGRLDLGLSKSDNIPRVPGAREPPRSSWGDRALHRLLLSAKYFR